MGEAWKRRRAAAFKHQSCVHYDRLIEDDLLRLARETKLTREVTAQLAPGSGAVEVGAECLLQPTRDGTHQVVLGNRLLAQLPTEAQQIVDRCANLLPSFNGLLMCRVTRIGAFGALTLVIEGQETE